MRDIFEIYIVVGLAIAATSMVLWRSYARPPAREADRTPHIARGRLTLGAAAISVNALALLLVSLAALTHLGWEISKVDSPDRSAAQMPALEALLQRLPDSDKRDSQHREIVAAIRSLTPPAPATAPVNDAAIPAAFSKLQTRIEKLEGATEQNFSSMKVLEDVIGLLLVCALVGGAVLVAWALFAERNANKKWMEGVGGAALLLASVVGGAKLKADFKPAFSLARELHVDPGAFSFRLLDLKNINFEFGRPRPAPSPEPQRDVDVYLHLDVGQSGDAVPASMDCGPNNDRRIGPFDDGDVKLSANGQRSLDDIVKDINQRLVPTPENPKPDRLTAIMLIGSADKRSLKPKTVALYSSNAGLARARVAVVREALEGAFGSAKPPILEAYAGPLKTSVTLPVRDLSTDRSVQVCILWDRKQENRMRPDSSVDQPGGPR